MVTIKIQSSEDIIQAYFRNLGFSEKQLPELVKIVLSGWGKDSKSGDELLNFMDQTVLGLARKIFGNSGLTDGQLVAQFKLCFMLCNGAEKYSAQMIKNQKMPTELSAEMRRFCINTAPECQFSEMLPQEIVSSAPGNFLHKFFHRKDGK